MKLLKDLKQIAKQESITNYKIAMSSDLTQSTVGRILNGEQMPRLDTFEKMADACGYTIIISQKSQIPEYRKRLEKLIKDVCHEDFYTENEYKRVVEEYLRKRNTSIEKLIKGFELGIKKGYSIKEQEGIINELLNEK